MIPATLAIYALEWGGGFGKIVLERNANLSRCCNTLSLGAVTWELAAHFQQTQNTDELSGLLTFGIRALRSGLLVGIDKTKPRHLRWQKGVGAAAFLAGSVIWLASEYYNPSARSVFAEGGLAIDCAADLSNDQVVRRRCFMALGCCVLPFALLTGARGLAVKNVMDIVGSAAGMIYYQDPLPRLRPRQMLMASRRLSQPRL